jgi:hypothetical protein
MNNKKTIYLVSIGALVLLLIVGILAYFNWGKITNLFSRAGTTADLNWGNPHPAPSQNINMEIVCLAPVRTQPGQAFALDSETRFRINNDGSTAVTNFSIPVESDYSALLDPANVTVSIGTYTAGIWKVPSLASGASATIRFRKNNMPAQPFSLSLTTGYRTITSRCTAGDYFPVLPAQNPEPTPIGTDEPVIVPLDKLP